MRNIPIIGRLLLAALCLVGFYQSAHAQTVGTYTEQNGITKNAVGVTVVQGTVPVAATATPADATSNTNVNASRTQAFGMVFNGTTWDRQEGDTNGTVVQPALSATYWAYAPPVGGLVNSATAVAVKAAAGASIRNYVLSMQCSQDTLGAATELAVLDGATVVWRGKLNTTPGIVADINFNPPLRGTANTAVNIQTVTAVTGGVYCSFQGYTGS